MFKFCKSLINKTLRGGVPVQRGARKACAGELWTGCPFLCFVSFGQAKEMKALTKLNLPKWPIRSRKFLNILSVYPFDMTKIYVVFSALVLCSFLLGQTPLYAGNPTARVAFVDDEYDKFRKEGDVFFKQGDYKRALNKYLSCLEVPSFSNDEYAKTQADLCQKAVKLVEDADAALSKKNNKKALGHLEELLTLNPNDAAAKKKLAALWVTFGAENFEKALYKEAISDYQRALTYGPDKQIEQLIKTAERKLAEAGTTTTKKSPILKIGVGVLGVGAGLYALKLNSDWKTKLSAIDKAQQSGDNAGYQTAYNDAAQFQSSQGLRNICVGVAAVAVAAEVFLLVRKPKTTQPKISLTPASSSIGLALNYRF